MTYPLPSGWQEVKLGDITKILAGGTPSTKNKEYWNGNILWLTSGELNNKKIYTTKTKITEKGLENSNTRIIPIESILIGLAGQGKTRGTVAINYVELCTNQSVASILPNEYFIQKYLYYQLDMRYKELRSLSYGDGGRGGLNLKILNNLIVKVPPLEEQKRIAEVLSLCDDIIENLTELIDKKEQYKKGVMQRLLSGEVRFKGFTDEWQKYKLLDIGISYSGLTNKNASNFIDNCNAKYVTYKSIYDSNKIDINRLEDVFVEKDEKQNLVQYGDAFFTISSETPDEVAISSVLLDKVDNTYLNSFCFGFRFDFNILLPEFARYYFRSNYIRKYTYKLSQGSTRFNLSKNKFLEMIINIPSIEEQKKIAGLLSVIDEEIENLKKQLELRKQQKKGLMQKLLTGEVRV